MGKATLYEILGVTPQSESVVIEAAYKAMMKIHHPDICGGDPIAADKASELNEAFFVLRDAERRANYDAQLRHGGGALWPDPNLEWTYAAAQPPTADSGGATAPMARRGIMWRPGAWMAAAFVVGAGITVAGTIRDRGAAAVSDAAKDAVTREMDADPPDLRIKDIRRGVVQFRKVFKSSGIAGVRQYSDACSTKARQAESWKTASVCFGFDVAGSHLDIVRAGENLSSSYFAQTAAEGRLRDTIVKLFDIPPNIAAGHAARLWKQANVALAYSSKSPSQVQAVPAHSGDIAPLTKTEAAAQPTANSDLAD